LVAAHFATHVLFWKELKRVFELGLSFEFICLGDAELLKCVAVSVKMTAFFLGLLANLLVDYCPTRLLPDIAMTTVQSLITVIENLQSLFVVRH